MIIYNLKKIFSVFAKSSGIITARVNRIARNSFLILMYHRIIEPKKSGQFLEPGMYVNPDTFESHLQYLKSNFDILPLKDLVSGIKVDPGSPTSPRCALTFDDGWRDFYENAFPLLLKYNVPATVFLPTDYIGSDDWFWTDRIAHLMRNAPADGYGSEARDPVANGIRRIRGPLHERVDRAIRTLKSCPKDTIDAAISDLAASWGIPPNPPGRAFLSWEEVGELSRSGLVRFGSHTASHRILTTIDDEDAIRRELGSAKEELVSRKAADQDFIPFCYPNGSLDDRIVELVRQAGYQAALTTISGWNQCGTDPFLLKRVGIHQDMTTGTAMFGCRIAGLI